MSNPTSPTNAELLARIEDLERKIIDINAALKVHDLFVKSYFGQCCKGNYPNHELPKALENTSKKIRNGNCIVHRLNGGGND